MIDDVASVYAELGAEIVARILSQSLIALPQDESKVTYSLWRDEEDYRIDWHDDAKRIEHFVACVGFPYKGASFVARGNLFRNRLTPTTRIAHRSLPPGSLHYLPKNSRIEAATRSTRASPNSG